MVSPDNKPLNLIEAARLIYQTRQPTADQIYRVRARLKGGVLKGTRDEKSRWTTTTEFIAEYLARQSVYQRGRQKTPVDRAIERHATASQVGHSSTHSRTLRNAYGDVLKEYFLAVFLRQKHRHRSKLFQRCVVATQVGIVILVFWLAAATIKLGFIPVPPERRIVEQWIAENTGGRFQILEWHRLTATPEGSVVAVDYRYFRNGAKPVETHRTFLVVGDQVKLLENE